MAARAMLKVWRRDDDNDDHEDAPIMDTSGNLYPDHDDDDDYYNSQSWWWSDTGMAVRYTIICLIFLSIFLYFFGGYWHARRRLKKGLQPLAYHRWMVHRTLRYGRSQHTPRHQQDPYQEGYAMHGYAAPPNPPPAYQRDAPPAYEPPQGASKAMADQHFHGPLGVPGNGNAGESSTQLASGARR